MLMDRARLRSIIRPARRVLPPGGRAASNSHPAPEPLPRLRSPRRVWHHGAERPADPGRASLAAEGRLAVELYVMEGRPAAEAARLLGLPKKPVTTQRRPSTLKRH